MKDRIEAALAATILQAEEQAPSKLASALRYTVFPGGARIRPRLCLAVAEACSEDVPVLTDGVAAAIELLHCASLVHDDLPCFDDANERRGKPSVHRVYGEPIAVLVGDGLIVLAFETLARAAVASGATHRLASLIVTLTRAAGTPNGLVAGQAWESEPSAPLAQYHQAKTASLFLAATMGGALAAGKDPSRWRALGEHIGEAYQVADDLLDALSDTQEAGKPTKQDVLLGRPSAVLTLGLDGALAKLRSLVDDAVESVPDCHGRASLQKLVLRMAERLVPTSLKQSAA